MNLILYFIIAFVLSFLGSLPIGLITLTITQKTIENGRQSAILIALGATIMEFIYTFIALMSLDFFMHDNDTAFYIKVFATIVFLGMGLHFIIKKNDTAIKLPTSYNYYDFLRGIIVGMMNMLIVPFWIFLGAWLQSNGIMFEETACIFSFSIGSASGAFLAFLGYIWLSEYVASKSTVINQYTNKAVGVLFLGLGIFQLTQFM